IGAFILLAVLGTVSNAAGQTPASPALPRVFLDCQGNVPCDMDHFRTEIEFVNWAQDPADADVHVIATSEGVGGGGNNIRLDFIGRERMASLVDTLSYISSGSDVFAETRDGFTQILRLGLVRYAIANGLAPSFSLDFDDP